MTNKNNSCTLVLIMLLMAGCSQFKPTLESQQTVNVSDFTNEGINGWQEQSFKDNTRYNLVEISGKKVLKAQTDNAASGLFKEMTIDIQETPYLNWSWLVENTYDGLDPHSKDGDDYPARIYVVVKDGPFPWDTKALNYIWCNNQTDQVSWKNPFSNNSIMIPVRCGQDKLGAWQTERVNVVEDFQRFFNLKVNKIHVVAVMSDSDNAQGSAVAYYGDITFTD